MKPHYDVIVVGGGPGGSTAATLCAKRGARVLLCEGAVFPRYQIGESLLPSTIHGVVRLLGLCDELKKAGFVKKNGGNFIWGKNEEMWKTGFGEVSNSEDYSFAYQVERSKFDALLLENSVKNGVEVRQNAPVKSMVKEGERVVGVELDSGEIINARFVIDASGHKSRIYNQIGRRLYSELFQNVALHGYFNGAGRLPAPDQGNILSSAFSLGWVWYIPLRDDLTSVGVVVAKQHAKTFQGDRKEIYLNLLKECAPVQKMLEGATLATEAPYDELRIRSDYSYTCDRFTVPGAMLVGDAACFLDPVLSTGVHLATFSALLAARTITSSLTDPANEERYVDEFARRYRREYAMYYRFLAHFYDSNRDRDSYYWKAKSLLATSESSNVAFVQLLAGLGSWPQAVHDTGSQFLKVMAATPVVGHAKTDSYRDVLVTGQGLLDTMPATEGLRPSADGLSWDLPAEAAAKMA